MKNLVKVLVVITFVFSTLAFAGSDNTFTNVTVGFSVTKPDAWQFFTAEQNLENLKKTRYNNFKRNGLDNYEKKDTVNYKYY